MTTRITRTVLAAFAIAALATLTACTPSVPFEPAPDAADPACAEVIVRLPDTVADLERRETNAQATGAWGNPASVLLRCGVESPPPTTDRCITVNGVDWVEDASQAPQYRFISYGRVPAVEVVLDNDVVSGSTVITDLSAAVSLLPQERHCLSVDDVELPPSN